MNNDFPDGRRRTRVAGEPAKTDCGALPSGAPSGILPSDALPLA